ncbi:hypothetical protein ACLOJK_019710 [Asimina triloba]
MSVPSLLEAERKKECSLKRAHLVMEGDSSVEPGLSSKIISKLPPIEGTPPVVDLGAKQGSLCHVAKLSEHKAALP